MRVPWLTSIDGTQRLPLLSIGHHGAWGDLGVNTRWGDGPSGNYELKWSMPLRPSFEHPLLRRGTLVELMDGSYRVGSPFVLSEPAKAEQVGDLWQFVATGTAREVDGSDSFYAADGSGNATTVPTTAVTQAIADGWRIAGYDVASVPAVSPSTLTASENLNQVGEVLSASATAGGKRWYVGQDNVLYFGADPTTPTYQVTPNAVAMGTSDDNYASTVKVRYLDSSTATYLTRIAVSANIAARFGVKQYMADITDRGPMSAASAQAVADQTLALAKGRLAYTNSLTLTSNELLTIGGASADLSKAAEDAGTGIMVRLNGISSDLLEYNGQTWLDIVIGEAQYVDGEPTIQLAPIGLAPRDVASIIESLAGPAAA